MIYRKKNSIIINNKLYFNLKLLWIHFQTIILPGSSGITDVDW